MSNELLAKVAFAAMNGDGEQAYGYFEEYCVENNIETVPPEVNLEAVAKGCIGVLSDNCEIGEVVGAFGLAIAKEAPNETDEVEEIVDAALKQ